MKSTSHIDSTRTAIAERQITALSWSNSSTAKSKVKTLKFTPISNLERRSARSRRQAILTAWQAKAKALPPLAGVPVAIKDVMVTKGVRTTAGSKILGNYIPPYDCTAVARLEAAGAVVLGKMNCDEFAMGSSNENSAYGSRCTIRAILTRSRRLLWRLGGRRGRRHGGGDAGFGHGRLDSSARFVLRRRRAEADLRTRVALRLDRVCVIARSHWAADEDGKGRGHHAATIAGRDPMDSTSADVPVPDYVAESGKAGAAD